jgi:uncharacterized protein
MCGPLAWTANGTVTTAAAAVAIAAMRIENSPVGPNAPDLRWEDAEPACVGCTLLRFQAYIDIRYVTSNVNVVLLKNDASARNGCKREKRRLSCCSMTGAPISTPCKKICAVEGQTGLCVGCGRTLREIAAWTSYDEARRQQIMAELPARLAARAKLTG